MENERKWTPTEWNDTDPIRVDDMLNVNAGIRQAAPVGAFSWYFGKRAPVGWLICDGKTKLRDDPQYSKLYELLGQDFVPDLMKGQLFVRAAASPDTVKAEQGDGIKAHTHPHTHNTNAIVRSGSGNHNSAGNGTACQGTGQVMSVAGDYNDRCYLNTGGAVGGVSEGAETRPVNMALLPIIKY